MDHGTAPTRGLISQFLPQNVARRFHPAVSEFTKTFGACNDASFYITITGVKTFYGSLTATLPQSLET